MNQIAPHLFNGLSIVIPAYNEEKALPLTLASINEARSRLESAAGVQTELIVVDNVSTDGTSQIVARYGARVIRHEIRNIGSVRNAGIHAAVNDLVVTVDADTLVPGYRPVCSFLIRRRRFQSGDFPKATWRPKTSHLRAH